MNENKTMCSTCFNVARKEKGALDTLKFRGASLWVRWKASTYTTLNALFGDSRFVFAAWVILRRLFAI